MLGSADDAWDALNAGLGHDAPPCSGLPVFTAASRTDEQRAECASICAGCPIADLCGAYAVASKVDTGYWAGVDRAEGRIKHAGRSTTDSGAVPRSQMKEGTP